MREKTPSDCATSATASAAGAGTPGLAPSVDATDLVTQHRDGFSPGYTAITGEDEGGVGQGVDFGIHVLALDQSFEEVAAKESAWVLMHGRAHVACAGREFAVERHSLFDEAPT